MIAWYVSRQVSISEQEASGFISNDPVLKYKGLESMYRSGRLDREPEIKSLAGKFLVAAREEVYRQPAPLEDLRYRLEAMWNVHINGEPASRQYPSSFSNDRPVMNLF